MCDAGYEVEELRDQTFLFENVAIFKFEFKE